MIFTEPGLESGLRDRRGQLPPRVSVLVKGKNSQMLVCQDRECGHRETLSRTSSARCPVCHNKMGLRGKGDGQLFVCKCGHKEKLSAFKEPGRRKGPPCPESIRIRHSLQTELEKPDKKLGKNCCTFWMITKAPLAYSGNLFITDKGSIKLSEMID